MEKDMQPGLCGTHPGLSPVLLEAYRQFCIEYDQFLHYEGDIPASTLEMFWEGWKPLIKIHYSELSILCAKNDLQTRPLNFEASMDFIDQISPIRNAIGRWCNYVEDKPEPLSKDQIKGMYENMAEYEKRQQKASSKIGSVFVVFLAEDHEGGHVLYEQAYSSEEAANTALEKYIKEQRTRWGKDKYEYWRSGWAKNKDGDWRSEWAKDKDGDWRSKWAKDKNGDWRSGCDTLEVLELPVDSTHHSEEMVEASTSATAEQPSPVISSTQGHFWELDPEYENKGEFVHYLCKLCGGRNMEMWCRGEANKKHPAYIAAQERKATTSKKRKSSTGCASSKKKPKK